MYICISLTNGDMFIVKEYFALFVLKIFLRQMGLEISI